jgi:hypothetical protein
MAHALNFVIPIKQDPETLARLATLESVFADKIQSKINAALKKSGIVHFARLFVIDHKYLLVITEYDGDDFDYTEFFRRELKDIFGLLFSLAEKAPPPEVIENEDKFREFAKSLQVRSLGKSMRGDTDSEGKPVGYLFSAYGNRKVRDILAKLPPEDDNADL